jgi:hypothetical protein
MKTGKVKQIAGVIEADGSLMGYITFKSRGLTRMDNLWRMIL